MYELFGYFDQYGSYRTMGTYETLDEVHEEMDWEGCEWVACAEGDEDYRVYHDGELVERWY